MGCPKFEKEPKIHLNLKCNKLKLKGPNDKHEKVNFRKLDLTFFKPDYLK
jgi:hypothetical protein